MLLIIIIFQLILIKLLQSKLIIRLVILICGSLVDHIPKLLTKLLPSLLKVLLLLCLPFVMICCSPWPADFSHGVINRLLSVLWFNLIANSITTTTLLSSHFFKFDLFLFYLLISYTFKISLLFQIISYGFQILLFHSAKTKSGIIERLAYFLCQFLIISRRFHF